ncbi:unnamed protein product [Phaedon cochleariae]|uniref:Trehalose 6-phosphate phosphatase n=1 Tax=Phaedon cochleariae TaxID=80249 RepID=A0A9P0DXA3_PHACE|nr:unnamed protein product [Phaedon cochleariae]
MVNTFDDYEDYLKNYLGKNSKLAVLLDYDGTLTPLVAHPDLAKIPLETKRVLQELSELPDIFIAVISGRAVKNVKEMVGLENITYAGNHGMEVLYPDGSSYVHQLPKDFDDQKEKMIKELENTVVRDGAWIENKGSTLTFHFRAVPEHLRGNLEKTAKDVMERANFKVGKAHCALEARPQVDWNKGKVALLLLEQKYGDNWNKNVKVIFVGDDTTDEDAMQSLKDNAATFRIAASKDVMTHAEKLISSTDQVLNILKLIENIYKHDK